MKNDIALITPASKDLLYVKIADAIHAYIRQNDLKPGDRLPSERALTEQFKTGRHSVREALRVLENKGIIEVRMGKGTYVAENTFSSSFYMEFVKVNYLELVNIKTELEKYAVREAIKHATTEQLAVVEEQLFLLEQGYRAGKFFSETDAKFHQLLIGLSGNKMLVQMIRKMIDAFEEYYGVLQKDEQRCLDTIPWHRELFNAIRNHDQKTAENACDIIKEINYRLGKSTV